MKSLILADDLSNQSLFGFKRSHRLKQISLLFCARIQAQLKIVHIDDPQAFHYQEPLYKKYLEHVRLNRKSRIEFLPTGQKVTVEYVLEEGQAIPRLVEVINQTPSPVGIVAGTSNRYGLGRLRIGSRVKKLSMHTQIPVLIFGLKAVRHFDIKLGDEFCMTAVTDEFGFSPKQLACVRGFSKLFSARLRVLIFREKQNLYGRIRRFFKNLFVGRKKLCDMEEIKKTLPDAEVEVVEGGFLKRKLLREIKFKGQHLIAVPEDFAISPFFIARRSVIPVVPLTK